MQATLLQENLNSALSVVSRFVANRAQLPVLSNILITTDSGRLRLSATNLELGINYWLGGKIDTEGSFTVPAKEITEFVSYLTPGNISLSLNDQSLLELSSLKARSTFTTTPSADFPEIPHLNPATAFELDTKTLFSSVLEVSPSSSLDDSRPVLTAILCQFTSTSCKLVATDGFRLSVKEISLPQSVTLPPDTDSLTYLIPSKSFTEITKLFKSVSSVKFGFSQDSHQLVFASPDLEVSTRIIEGEFPDYHRIIPQSFATTANVSRSDLLQAVKIASVFAKESANVVKLSLKNNHIDVSANAVQVGQNKAEVDAAVTGESLDVAFNYKFLTDFLSVCQGDSITISLNEPLTPGLFQDSSNTSLTHIIMPVRIQD